MGTIVKRKSLFPSTKENPVDNFFDDFITRESFDTTDRNLVALNGGLTSVNLKEIDANIEVELAEQNMKRENFKFEIDNTKMNFCHSNTSEKVEKNDNFIGLEFNYRSFCRLPNT